MRGVDDDFDCIVQAIAFLNPLLPQTTFFLFQPFQRNVRQIRFDLAMDVLRIYSSKSLTIFIQQIQGEIYLHAKEGGRAAISSWQFYRSKVFAPVQGQCVEKKYAQLDDPRTVFHPIIGISIC